MKYRWRPDHLDKVLRFGLDPRSSRDAIPILNSLRSGLFTLSRDVSPESQRSIQTLSLVDKARLLGPQFECPTCREILIASPGRSFIIEGLLEALPAEGEEWEASSMGAIEVGEGSERGLRTERGKRAGGSRKGKEKAKSWSIFFGQGLGNGGY